jgi:hypothetical protein
MPNSWLGADREGQRDDISKPTVHQSPVPRSAPSSRPNSLSQFDALGPNRWPGMSHSHLQVSETGSLLVLRHFAEHEARR